MIDANEVASLYQKRTELLDLNLFYSSHSRIFIYGNGAVGKGVQHYFTQSGWDFEKVITTDTYNVLENNYTRGETGVVLAMSDKNICEVLPKLFQFMDSNDIFILPLGIRERLSLNVSKEYLNDNMFVYIAVATTCNLNCASCNTYSPICSPEFYNVEILKQDLNQLKSIVKDTNPIFTITGGEAFLHPDIFAIFKLAREVFSSGTIRCYTNGIIPLSLSRDELIMLKNYDIELFVTEYPVNGMSYKKLYDKLSEHSIKYVISKIEDNKIFYKRSYYVDGNAEKYTYMNCQRYTGVCNGLLMKDGKIYRCEQSMNSHHLNQKFNTNFKLRESDYLDLYNITKDDLHEFFSNRIDFCDYCNHDTEIIPWGISKKESKEWI